MFKLQPNPTFWAAISIPMPGAKKDTLLDVEFKHKPKSDLDQYIKGYTAEADDAEYLSEIVCGWKGVDAEFNRENFALLLDNYPAAAREIVSGYISAMMESRKKN